MILRPLSTNVHSPNSSHCKFGAWQNSGARMTLEIELKYDFSKVIAQIPLLPCVLFGKNLFSTPNLLWSKVIAIYWVYI